MNKFRARQRPSFSQRDIRKHRPDYWIIMLATFLLAVGLVVVYAISPGVSQLTHVIEAYYVSKQLIAITMGILAFLIVSKIPFNLWRRCVKPLIVISFVTAIAVALFGTKVNGAYRWLQIGGVSFQAAELIKFSFLIWLADFLASQKTNGRLNGSTENIKPLAIALGLIVFVVGLLQSDFGSTVVILAMAVSMLFVAGMPLKKLGLIAGGLLLAGVLLISAIPYRRQRLLTYLHPATDCQIEGYQSCQALIAVGSGGLFGLGLGRSVQAFGYLPEAANDSIFAILAEKFGFIGVTIILTVYAIFFGRLAKVGEGAPDDFSQLIIIGMISWFSVQAAINIGAMIGLFPLKGITLPLISYGGTSLLFVTGALGLAFQISRYSNYSTTRQPVKGSANENFAYWRR